MKAKEYIQKNTGRKVKCHGKNENTGHMEMEDEFGRMGWCTEAELEKSYTPVEKPKQKKIEKVVVEETVGEPEEDKQD
jgi:hypothetical protein